MRQNVQLLPYNTFGLPAKAEHFAEIQSVSDLQDVLRENIRPVFVLGGGSNILLTRDLPG